jgi:hypothetical protein
MVTICSIFAVILKLHGLEKVQPTEDLLILGSGAPAQKKNAL